MTYAPAHPSDRPALDPEQMAELVNAMLGDMEEMAQAGLSGTELVAALVGVLYALLANSDHTPTERLASWREIASQVEQMLAADVN